MSSDKVILEVKENNEIFPTISNDKYVVVNRNDLKFILNGLEDMMYRYGIREEYLVVLRRLETALLWYIDRR